MAKYALTELGHVARDYVSCRVTTYVELGKEISKATGYYVHEPSFQQARRNDRGYEELRKNIMDYMFEQDPALVESSLAFYRQFYGQKGA